MAALLNDLAPASAGVFFGAPEAQSRQNKLEVDVPDRIDGEPAAVLARVQEIVRRAVPEAKCELQDYDHRIGCGALDPWGNIQEVRFLRRELRTIDIEHQARVLAAKVATGGSTAVPADLDEDEQREIEDEELARDASRNSTTGY